MRFFSVKNLIKIWKEETKKEKHTNLFVFFLVHAFCTNFFWRLSYNIVETTSCQKGYIESMINRMRYEIVYNFNLVENIQRVSHFLWLVTAQLKHVSARNTIHRLIYICAFVRAVFSALISSEHHWWRPFPVTTWKTVFYFCGSRDRRYRFDCVHSICFYRNRESIDMIHHCSFELSEKMLFYRTDSPSSGSIDLQCQKYQQDFS